MFLILFLLAWIERAETFSLEAVSCQRLVHFSPQSLFSPFCYHYVRTFSHHPDKPLSVKLILLRGRTAGLQTEMEGKGKKAPLFASFVRSPIRLCHIGVEEEAFSFSFFLTQCLFEWSGRGWLLV